MFLFPGAQILFFFGLNCFTISGNIFFEKQIFEPSQEGGTSLRPLFLFSLFFSFIFFFLFVFVFLFSGARNLNSFGLICFTITQTFFIRNRFLEPLWQIALWDLFSFFLLSLFFSFLFTFLFVLFLNFSSFFCATFTFFQFSVFFFFSFFVSVCCFIFVHFSSFLFICVACLFIVVAFLFNFVHFCSFCSFYFLKHYFEIPPGKNRFSKTRNPKPTSFAYLFFFLFFCSHKSLDERPAWISIRRGFAQ